MWAALSGQFTSLAVAFEFEEKQSFMKIATSELEHLREEVKNCHRIIKNLQKKREFVGLTDEEIQTAWDSVMDGAVFTRREVYKAIEAKLRSKNNG